MPRVLMLVAGAIVALTALNPATVSRQDAVAAPAPTVSKCITYGPTYDGRSVLPDLERLGVRVWQLGIVWPWIAASRPKHPTDPHDPAYVWPRDVDAAVRSAAKAGIEPVLYVNGFTPWSNGGQDIHTVSKNPRDFARFMAAVVKHYTKVRRFVVFSEPSHFVNFKPQGDHGKAAPHAYARILDAAYGMMHAARKNVVVIGGNVHPSGNNDDQTTAPDTFLENMVLPNGWLPRLDEFGVNPYTERPLDLRLPKQPKVMDFDDLDWLLRQLDKDWPGKQLKLFIGEFGWNTEHGAQGWLYVVTRAQQARKLKTAFRLAESLERVDTICWFLLYDPPPQKSGDFYVNWTSGLATYDGRHKPSWAAFARVPSGPRRIGGR
jgi:hypothetical protein